MSNQINVTKSSLPEFSEYLMEIESIWNNHWLTNMGEKHQHLSERLQEYLKVPNITLFSNGHLALECAIAAFDLSGEIITTPFTFASTTHAITRNGLEAVFCDINNDNYTIDSEKIESLITEKTTAILPVHVYANICDVRKIEKIAKKYNLKVIYDAAHAFGVTVDKIGVASFGDASMFSFHATKVFHTIEGGAVTYNDAALKERLDAEKNFGITGPDLVEFVGGNAKMNEFQAAMGLCNLKNIDEEIEKRGIVAKRYYERLSGIKGIRLSQGQEGVKCNYAYMPVLFDGYKLNRDEVFEILKGEEIFVRKYFYPLTNSFSCYANRYSSAATPTAKHVADRIITLPLYADLSLREVDRICDLIVR